MKAAYIKAPFQFEIREVPLRPLLDDEVLVTIEACSVCGHDLIMASSGASEWQPFGHEISGVVEQTGSLVDNVSRGDTVVLESGTFNRFSSASRNGRVDLDNTGPNFWLKGDDTMGFAQQIIVPREVCVPYSGIPHEAASLVEPMGVALDLVKTADIHLGQTVLVIGLGPIGLMAARMAQASGGRIVYGAELSCMHERIRIAHAWGVSEIVNPDIESIGTWIKQRGQVDRVLVTAPPSTIPEALAACAVGGIVAFLGIDYGPGGKVTFDSNLFHTRKLQLRSSFASPALYFPECLELIRAGIVDPAALVSHRFSLENIGDAVREFVKDKHHAVKAVMLANQEA